MATSSTLPDRSYNKIFVLGEIAKPGSLVMNKKRSTLAEALSDAGYINQNDCRSALDLRDAWQQPIRRSCSTSTRACRTRCCWPIVSRCDRVMSFTSMRPRSFAGSA
jgi:hypothetical protein